MSEPSQSGPPALQREHVEKGFGKPSPPNSTILVNTSTVGPLRLSPPDKSDMEWQSEGYHTWRILRFTWTGQPKRLECARLGLEKTSDRQAFTDLSDLLLEVDMNNGISCGLKRLKLFEVSSRGRATVNVKQLRTYKRNHLVLGIMNRRTGLPREVAIDFKPNLDAAPIRSLPLFFRMRKAVGTLRPWWRRVFSLKSVSGFSVYECLPKQGYHVKIEIDDCTRVVLDDFYHDYVRTKYYMRMDMTAVLERKWLSWIQQSFNQGDVHDDASCLALELVLRWSVFKICIYGLTPVIFSLAVGLWFQYSQPGDRLTVVQTAWTISSFVIGASSILFALLAAATQLGDI